MSTTHEIPSSVKKYLDASGVPYEIIEHAPDFVAQRTAEATHTPGRRFAKCVLIWADNYYAMVVLPADHFVDFDRLRVALGAREAGLVREEEMRRLFPDCEVGAEPPFGVLYQLPMFFDTRLDQAETMTFNAGTHEEVIRMLVTDFKRITQPTVIDVACDTKVKAKEKP
jgi:Ala-tRNA(Pro) deacylase